MVLLLMVLVLVPVGFEGGLVGWLGHGWLVAVRSGLVETTVVEVMVLLVGLVQGLGRRRRRLEVSIAGIRAVIVGLRLLIMMTMMMIAVVGRHRNGGDRNIVQLRFDRLDVHWVHHGGVAFLGKLSSVKYVPAVDGIVHGEMCFFNFAK